jgi:hypothetical protein
MHRALFVLPLLLLLFACQNTSPSADEIFPPEEEFSVRYSPSDLQKMHWLAGAWKGSEIRQSFQFHGGNALEILIVEKEGKMESCSFMWRDGRYYYGQNRQWVVTWIGEKDVRLDPLQPGLSPMTWTRLNGQRWHLVRHLPNGEEVTVMESANEMQP